MTKPVICSSKYRAKLTFARRSDESYNERIWSSNVLWRPTQHIQRWL